MIRAQRAELELELLEHKKDLVEAELELFIAQSNIGMFINAGDEFVELRLLELIYERNQLNVEIPEKKLSLFDCQNRLSRAV